MPRAKWQAASERPDWRAVRAWLLTLADEEDDDARAPVTAGDVKLPMWIRKKREAAQKAGASLRLAAQACALMASAPDAETLRTVADVRIHGCSNPAGCTVCAENAPVKTWLRSVASLLREEEGT